MPRSASVREARAHREVLEEEVDRLREVPYTLWQEVVKAPVSRVVGGRDGRAYRLRVQARYVGRGPGGIRVTVELLSLWLRRRLLRSGFIISPDNRFAA